MADVTRNVRSKTAHDPRNLVYGHFGSPTYRQRDEEWSFVRESNTTGDNGPVIKLLHAEQITTTNHNDASDTPDQSLSTSRSSGKSRSRPFGNQYNLELALKSVSWDCANPPQPVPTRAAGAQVVFCYALSPYERHYHRSLWPIAIIFGEPGSSLLYIHDVHLQSVPTFNHILPRLSQSAQMITAPYREPVLEVTCSSDRRLLAVRQRCGTSIVSIIDHGQDGSPDNKRRFTFETIVTLPRSRTGGHTQSHIIIHTGVYSSVGIVDEHGNWSIWRIVGRNRHNTRILFGAQLQVLGKLLPSEPFRKTLGRDIYFDGWHKMLWLSSTDIGFKIVLVCSRRVARLFRLDGSSCCDVDLQLGPPSQRNWILDVQGSLVDKSTCYVLTSTRVMVMEAGFKADGQLRFSAVCSWSHFRGSGNLELRMTVLEDVAARYLILCQQHEPPVLYALNIRENVVASITDPQVLQLPHNLHGTANLAFQLVKTKTDAHTRHAGHARSMIKMIAIERDGAIVDALYEISAPRSRSPDDALEGTLLIPRRGDQRIKSSIIVDDEDDLLDFVVPDDLEVIVPAWPRRNLYHERPGAGPHRNWKDILASDSKNGMLDALDSFKDLEITAAGFAADQETLHVVGDLLKDVYIPDIEELSEVVDQWRNQSAESGILSSFALDTDQDLLQVYHDIAQKWVEPLSRDLPDRARVQTERLSRNVALDQLAANMFLRKSLPTDPIASPTQDTFASSPPSGVAEVPSQMTGTEDLPPGIGVEEALKLLSRYTTVGKAPSAITNTRTATDIMAHLPEDLTGPATYCFTEIEARLKEQHSQDALLNLSETERRKVARATARKEKRMALQQRKRDEATQQSSYVPGIAMSSQQNDPRQIQSSQLVPEVGSSSQGDLMPMTQPERGAHGERRKVGKKGGKRLKGF